MQRGFLFQNGGTLTDNLNHDANIIVTDVQAANGIIHAIDAVLLPYAPWWTGAILPLSKLGVLVAPGLFSFIPDPVRSFRQKPF